MNRPDKGDLIAKALRDNLSEAEKNQWERILENDPELRNSFAEEQALDRVLDRMPDVPISSNFTALTLQAAMREPPPVKRLWPFSLAIFQSTFAQAVAVLVGVCAVGIGVGVQYHNSQRADMARKVRSFTEIASAIGSDKVRPEELFQNFEAIRALPTVADADVDMELFAALQK
jgi:anti-sigma factor RsiW